MKLFDSFVARSPAAKLTALVDAIGAPARRCAALTRQVRGLSLVERPLPHASAVGAPFSEPVPSPWRG